MKGFHTFQQKIQDLHLQKKYHTLNSSTIWQPCSTITCLAAARQVPEIEFHVTAEKRHLSSFIVALVAFIACKYSLMNARSSTVPPTGNCQMITYDVQSPRRLPGAACWQMPHRIQARFFRRILAARHPAAPPRSERFRNQTA